MKLAIETKLGTATPTSTQVVDLLYTNVVGVVPTENDKAPFVQWLETGTYSIASLGVMAANSSFNEDSINLVGLQTAGLQYTSL